MQWDHLVNAFEGHRHLPGGGVDRKESRHFMFVREFASVTSLLQVRDSTVWRFGPSPDRGVGQSRGSTGDLRGGCQAFGGSHHLRLLNGGL